jgi:general secretion pathway protein N
MMARRLIIGTAMMACIVVAITGELAGAAYNKGGADPGDDDAAGQSLMPTPGSERVAQPSTAKAVPPSGNPLWAIPVQTLRATRERPIFLPSRRPPAPAVATAPYVPVTKTVAPPVEPDRPPLNLVGVVVGAVDGFAVFINSNTRDIVRLKTGEGYEGWILRSVQGREAVLEKNNRNAIIGLPQPTGGKK